MPYYLRLGLRGMLMALCDSVVKNPPTKARVMQDRQVPSLGREDPLEEAMSTPSSILPGKSHGQRSLVGYSPWGRKELVATE